MPSKFPATDSRRSRLKLVPSAFSILFLLYWLSSISLLADPMDVTILNQTFTTSVNTQGLSLRCNQTGTASATCSTQESTGNPSGPAETYATASASPSDLLVEGAAVGGLPNELFAVATSKVTDTVLITGGQGTGYLNVVFDYSAIAIPNSSNADLSVNGQSSQQGSPLPDRPVWLVASFTFGQPFAYSFDLGVIGDNLDEFDQATLHLLGAQVYAAQPSGCLGDPGYQAINGIGFCDDPNFTSANQAFSQVVAPEPATMLLFGSATLVLFTRRRRTTAAGVLLTLDPSGKPFPNPFHRFRNPKSSARMHFLPASQSFPNFRTRDCNNFGEK